MGNSRTYRPVVGLVGLHGDGCALALHQVVGVVHVLEAARADDRVDVASDLHPRPSRPGTNTNVMISIRIL